MDKDTTARAPILSRDLNVEKTSGNLDYLLEDVDEPKSGAWKVVLILIALALAVGFGYLRMRNGGMAWLNGSSKKPAATQTDDSNTGSTNPSPSSSPSADTSASNSKPATKTNASNTPVPSPAVPSPSTSATTSTQPPANTASANPPAAAPATSPADSSGTNAASTQAKSPPSSTAAVKPSKPSPPAASTADTDDAEDNAPPAAAAKPKPTPAVKADPVAEAEKYIYGKGVKQDCTRGMNILRPAAEHSNPRAMASLGVLYSAGLCTGRDLPTGYRWIALALRKEPDNQAFKDDLEKLWSEMTQPERQLAIKLSQ